MIPIPCLEDNYAYLLICETTHQAVVIDASEEKPIVQAVEQSGVKVTAIWSTHHHWDHVGGNAALAARWQVPVLGYVVSSLRIPAQTHFLRDGESWEIGKLHVQALHVPGHTLDALAYLVSDADGMQALFTGDTLFFAGCGRLFEGTAEQMHRSLSRLAQLPGGVLVYSGHEYAEANLSFALSMEPHHQGVRVVLEKVRVRRSRGVPATPSSIGQELAINPFLRIDSKSLRLKLEVCSEALDIEVFKALRQAKDNWNPLKKH
ncbi:hydroxyacylglutathione hydrolase [Pajaroellobacter abortibovis]|uniref:hydroxyacylglutathione hydrolase n=1 Tax=Pajaroellobacter abortibovis TaxID=1882918 RepID=UPI00155FB5E6|nr:hydroxyacylglutathione hydrolase [Pajaroellobacter abortibovis]